MPFGCITKDLIKNIITPPPSPVEYATDNIAFTLKLTKKNPTKANYEYIFKKWDYDHNLHPSKFYYEYDSKQKLHVHGVVMVDKEFNLNKLQQDKCHIFMKPIYSDDGWLRYITKDQHVSFYGI